MNETIWLNGQEITLDSEGYKKIFDAIDKADQNTARGMCYTIVQKLMEFQAKQPAYTKLLINVNGGVVQGVRSTNKNVKVELFDQDNMEAEGVSADDIQTQWEEKSAQYVHGVM